MFEFDNYTIKTIFIVLYMKDGAIIQYDLRDPRTPLPRFRSLVVPTALAK